MGVHFYNAMQLQSLDEKYMENLPGPDFVGYETKIGAVLPGNAIFFAKHKAMLGAVAAKSAAQKLLTYP